MQHFFDPSLILLESVFTGLVVILCLFIYLKTREILSLTYHKGIKYFRITFLYLAIAYTFRILLHLVMLSTELRFRSLMPFSVILVGYFSTMAFFYLFYSTFWKKVKPIFLTISNIAVISFSIIAGLIRSHHILLIIQLILIIFAILSIAKKKFSKMRTFYLLLLVFWVLNLSFLGPRRLIPYELNIFFHTISVIVLIYILYKVSKRTK